MTYPKYFDLNIGKNILTHLNVEDALKEIISNAFDEHIIAKIRRDIKIYKDEQNKWCIRDYGRGIKPSNFRFEINESKEDNDEIVGMFGFGLKDAIGILFTNNIKFKIYTENYIYAPVLKSKEGFPDEESIHIEVIKNKTYELNSGTEFVFNNLTLENIKNAKNKYVKFLNPDILCEINGFKIFLSDTSQSIFINGVEVYNNTGLQFSYDIKSSEQIRRCFNRDRKQLDINQLKRIIQNLLKNMIFDDKTNKEFLENIRRILKSKSEFLGEFNQIDVMRNIISQLNNNFVFFGIREKITAEIKTKIKDDNKEIYLLGDGVKQKFGIKQIKDLYYKDKFYRNYDENTIHINTSLTYASPSKEINVEEYILNIIEPVDRLFRLPSELKNKLITIKVIETETEQDESDTDESESEIEDKINKYGYDFDGDILKISKKYIYEKNKKELFVILFRYIVNNIDDDNIKSLSELKPEIKKGWFTF